jgi:hypothetical protein
VILHFPGQIIDEFAFIENITWGSPPGTMRIDPFAGFVAGGPFLESNGILTNTEHWLLNSDYAPPQMGQASVNFNITHPPSTMTIAAGATKLATRCEYFVGTLPSEVVSRKSPRIPIPTIPQAPEF